MNLIPDEELRWKASLNLAPMVDFLFLVIAVFATLAITRAALFDSEVELVKVTSTNDPAKQSQQTDLTIINLSVTESGHYKWITEFNEYAMENIASIEQELAKQQSLGMIPKDSHQTKILLHIDKKAEWEPIVQLIFSLKKAGFQINPVYEVEEAV